MNTYMDKVLVFALSNFGYKVFKLDYDVPYVGKESSVSQKGCPVAS